MRLITTALLCVSLAAPVAARPPLSDVAEIDNRLMAIAIADEIRKSCDDIRPRMLYAISQLNALKNRAKSLGYSDEEIEDYVTSDAEKSRMRKKAGAWLASKGVPADDKGALCAFGRQDIAQGGPVGAFLR